MLYYTILYHTIPYYTILYHSIPYYTILYEQTAIGVPIRSTVTNSVTVFVLYAARHLEQSAATSMLLAQLALLAQAAEALAMPSPPALSAPPSVRRSAPPSVPHPTQAALPQCAPSPYAPPPCAPLPNPPGCPRGGALASSPLDEASSGCFTPMAPFELLDRRGLASGLGTASQSVTIV